QARRFSPGLAKQRKCTHGCQGTPQSGAAWSAALAVARGSSPRSAAAASAGEARAHGEEHGIDDRAVALAAGVEGAAVLDPEGDGAGDLRIGHLHPCAADEL